MEYIINVSHVTKTVEETVVLNNINLQIKRGSICGFIGKIGSGKTMLMKMICGSIAPDTGSISVSGKCIGIDCDFPKEEGLRIEDHGFARYMPAKNNLRNPSSARKIIDRQKVKKALDQSGLMSKDEKWVSKYSLGMRRRLLEAGNQLEKTDILILDEPMSSLNDANVEDIRNLLMKLKERGRTVLISSNSCRNMFVLCESVYEMNKGHIEQLI